MKEIKKSPYMKLKDWFYQPDTEELDENLLKALSPIGVFNMFGTHSNLTIFLNKYYNNYRIFELDHYQFYKMLKKIVNEKNINKYSFSYFKSDPKDKSLNSIRKRFPYLKSYEIITLMNILEENDMIDEFEESMGMKKSKKKRMTKKERKEIENKHKKPTKSNNQITFNELINDFC